MKYIKFGLIHLVTLPWDILAWIAVLFVWLCWGTELRWQDRCLMCELKPGSWPRRTWFKRWAGACLGHAIIFKPGGMSDPELYKHEVGAHSEQFEGAMFLGVLNGANIATGTGPHVIQGAIIWALHGALFVLGNSVIAWLRGENFYRGASHEEGARGIAKGN